ncbi:DUF445 domain-containing protein [Salinicola rhizosphaerae]|uniref:Membrane protein n=1 Tax=Salinicola rhizosphaerae TaxID=1443141 RepID=A0ABQ3DXT7_9GAMM|nr:DUF445 domain-containing protein [Salinicola rhizosphaerae]GHB18408.1 membrane protein [Salinicola rhizosphaerae]
MSDRRRIAGVCLAIAAALYVAGVCLERAHPGFVWLTAFAEAALIGGIADWFAVTALFRHPLGLKIPHTAIVPRNRARLGRSLSTFIRENFLDEQYVRDSVARFDLAGALVDWLSRPARQRALAERLATALAGALSAIRQEAARTFLVQALRYQLGRLDSSRALASSLQVLVAERRHQALLDDSLKRLSGWLAEEENQERVKHFITDTVFRLFNPKVLGREVSFNRLAGWLIRERMVEQSARLIQAVSEDPEHPLRHHLDRQFAALIDEVRTDPKLRERLDTLRDDLLANERLADWLGAMWEDIAAWLASDLTSPDSEVRGYLERFIGWYADSLQSDPAARQWMNDQALAIIPPLVQRSGPHVDAWIERYLESLDSREIVTQIEKNVGNDLQYIRINGTLVGGLIGVAIHALTQLALWLGG